MKSATRSWPRPPQMRPRRVGHALTRLQMQSLEAWQRNVAGLEQLEQKGPAVKGPISVAITVRGSMSASRDTSLECYGAVLSEQLVRLSIIENETQIVRSTIQWGDVPVGVLIEVEETEIFYGG